MSAKFDEFPSLPFQDINEKPKHHGCMERRTEGRTTWKQYTPPQTQFAGGIIRHNCIQTLTKDHRRASQLIKCEERGCDLTDAKVQLLNYESLTPGHLINIFFQNSGNNNVLFWHIPQSGATLLQNPSWLHSRSCSPFILYPLEHL